MSPGQQCARNRASLLAGSAGNQNASFGAHVTAPLVFSLDLARHQPDAAGSAGTAPVGPGDNFQVMAIGVGEVDTPRAAVIVDLARAVAHRVGPVLKPSPADAAENSVKIRLADQEGVVLWADRAFGVGEVERDPVVEFHHVEMAEASRRWPTQHLGQEPSGHRLVGRPDDGVVELGSHAVVLVDCAMTVSYVGTLPDSIDHSQSIITPPGW